MGVVDRSFAMLTIAIVLVAVRSENAPDSSSANIGFRCVRH
jgi:hypothetical protein